MLPPDSIAAEINALIASKRLPVASPEGELPRSVPVTVRGCFDLVAARGIKGGRGRCACHTQASDAQRFDVPAVKDRWQRHGRRRKPCWIDTRCCWPLS